MGGIPTAIAAQQSFRLAFSQQKKLLSNSHLLNNPQLQGNHTRPQIPTTSQPVLPKKLNNKFGPQMKKSRQHVLPKVGQQTKHYGNQNQGKKFL